MSKLWGLFIVTHIIPLDDKRDHEEWAQCWCKPKLEDMDRLVIHNALDKREKYEHLRVV